MKKYTMFIHYLNTALIIIAFLVLPCTFSSAQTNPDLGDVNADGSVDIIDALLVAQYYVGVVETLPAIENADVNADGDINIVDALLIAQYYVGLIDTLPGNPTSVPTPGPTGTPTLPPDAPTPEPTPVPTATPSAPPDGPPVPSREIPYGQEIIMTYGETVKIANFNLIFTFADVNDSRCPRGLICVWEGEAVVDLICWAGNRYLGTMVIKAPPAEPDHAYVSDPATIYTYELVCKSVDPYPEDQLTIPKEDYTVTVQSIVILP